MGLQLLSRNGNQRETKGDSMEIRGTNEDNHEGVREWDSNRAVRSLPPLNALMAPMPAGGDPIQASGARLGPNMDGPSPRAGIPDQCIRTRTCRLCLAESVATH
jgi:hypothetical protein